MHHSRLLRPAVAFLSSCSLPTLVSLCESEDAKESNNVSFKHDNNPLLCLDGLPRFSEIKPLHVEAAMSEHLKKARKRLSRIEHTCREAKGKRLSYSSTVEALEAAKFPVSHTWRIVNHLMNVKCDDDLRRVHAVVRPEVADFTQCAGQSQPFYGALRKMRNDRSYWETLDTAQRRIIDASIRDMEMLGVGLSEADRKVFNRLLQDISDLKTKFANNVRDATNSYKLKITCPEDVEGLPISAKSLAAEQAKIEGILNATAEHGPWVVTLDTTLYLPCMKHLKNRSLRHKLYEAYITRASFGENDNSEVIHSLLSKKNEMAKILGYKHFAALSMAYKMAPNLEAVFELISSLREYAYPAAKQEFEELTQFAKSEGFHDELMNWDLHFWSERLREKKYQYAEEDLMQYLSLENVLEGLFNLTERLFGVVIIPADGKADVWDSDVRFFEIYEKDSKQYIASFYLDAYSRPDEKSEGAWMDVCLGKSKVIGISPVAYINCNGSPPMRGRPSLMSLREVENLFHEFGHGLQHMLSCVPHGDASGIRKIEWDAIELASQFMENWCYDRDTFFTFAKHYQTGEPSPEDLYHKVKAAKNFHAGTKLLRQLYFAALDLMLHSKCNGDSFLSPFDLQANIAADFAILPPLENDRFLCSFRHVFGGGYAAGYYGYIWAEVMSADAFAAFEEVGLENKDLVREMGRKFRKSILALGGGEHPTKVYQLFRGKQASPDALLRHLGLKEKKQTLDLTKDLATSSSCHMETAVALQKRRE